MLAFYSVYSYKLVQIQIKSSGSGLLFCNSSMGVGWPLGHQVWHPEMTWIWESGLSVALKIMESSCVGESPPRRLAVHIHRKELRMCKAAVNHSLGASEEGGGKSIMQLAASVAFYKEEKSCLMYNSTLVSNLLIPWSMKFDYLYLRWETLPSTENETDKYCSSGSQICKQRNMDVFSSLLPLKHLSCTWLS